MSKYEKYQIDEFVARRRHNKVDRAWGVHAINSNIQQALDMIEQLQQQLTEVTAETRGQRLSTGVPSTCRRKTRCKNNGHIL